MKIRRASSWWTLGEKSTSLNARKPRGTGKKVDRNAGLNLVPDLNFRPNGKKALKEFVDEKSPKNDVEVTLTTVYYMQDVMALSKIGPAHWLNFTDIEDVRTTTQERRTRNGQSE
jgi:hypothetical protein